MAMQVRFLTDERAVQAEDLARASARAEHLEGQLSQAVADREGLRAALEDAQKHAHSMATAMQTLTADKVMHCLARPSKMISHSATLDHNVGNRMVPTKVSRGHAADLHTPPASGPMLSVSTSSHGCCPGEGS